MTGQCNHKRLILSTLVVALFTWAFDFGVHGNLLASTYEATKEMWRPMEEMQTLWPLCIIYHLAMAALVASAFSCCRAKQQVCGTPSTGCAWKKSFGFGLWVGLLLGIPQLMVYVWMPIQLALPLAWCATELVKWTLTGVLLHNLYACCEKKSA